MRRFSCVGTLTLGLLTWAQGAGVVVRGQAVQPLATDTVTMAKTSDASPAVFQFAAETAGVLTVVVRGTDGVDLRIAVTDDLGQPVVDGTADRDLGGDSGAEQVTVTLPAAGEYQVRVTSFSGSASGAFRIASGWIAFPDAQAPADPDGRPTNANALVPGTPIEGDLNPTGGDAWDWFVVTSDTAAAVTVLTEAPVGDLVIEVFREGEYGEATGRSDQDMDGITGNESLTARIEAGGRLYFKISTAFASQGPLTYSIRAGLL